jgi:glycerol-3-phosphate acyltransferase PlsX
VFDYEVVGGSPLLGVRGTVIITHGRARRRMIEHAVRVAATAVRGQVDQRISDALGYGPYDEPEITAAPAVISEAMP